VFRSALSAMDGRGAVTSSGHAVLTYVADISGHTFRANDCGAAGMEYIWDFGSGRLRQIRSTVIRPSRSGEPTETGYERRARCELG